MAVIWDNETGIGRGKRHADGVGAFTGTLATRLQRLKPYDPESKGVVERRNGFFETSFMPGREFASPADFNTQFSDWLTRTNNRIVRTVKARPATKDVWSLPTTGSGRGHDGHRPRPRRSREESA